MRTLSRALINNPRIDSIIISFISDYVNNYYRMNNSNEYEQRDTQTELELRQDEIDRLLNLDPNCSIQKNARVMINKAMELRKSIRWIGYSWSKKDDE
ncbi:MAG: hypothetical protein ACTSYA_05630 [Candidatus Kariarchaeaceae archaeon]